MKGVGGIAVGLRLGNLGFKIKGVTAQQVLAEPEYFKEILKKNKMIGFIGMHPTNEEHAALVHALYDGEYKPDEHDHGYYQRGLLKDQWHETIKDVENKEDPEWFLRCNWHVDNPFFDEPPSLISIHMTTYNVEHGYGNTFWVSLRNLFDECPAELREHLKTARFRGETGSEEHDVKSHPALRTHPDTGETMLYWTGPGTILEGEETPWFQDLRKYVEDYCAEPRNRYQWDWEVGDVVIWDNRAVMHGFYPGWERKDRIFQRVEAGTDQPFYDPEYRAEINENFGDVLADEDHQRDTSMGPNPDHIPLVFTKGFYALEGLEEYYQKVVMFTIEDEDGNARSLLQELENQVDDDEFFIYRVPHDENNRIFANLKRYRDHIMPDYPMAGCSFVCNRNGDFHLFLEPDRNLLENDNPDPLRCIPNQIRGFLEWHPDMRHAGHAWHYPDWFPHQPLQYRPWSYHNCSFMQYYKSDGNHPPEDFVVQFAIDSLYGCFNGLKDNEDRLRVISRVHDYIGYMLELNEHENDR